MAQQGNYFLSHYTPDDKQFDNVCFDMAQDDSGILYFATKSGILQFDGRNWDVAKGLGAAYTLCINASGGVFWGGANGFGKMGSAKNAFQHQKLSGEGVRDIFQSLALNNDVYFLNDKTLFIYSSSSSKTTEVKSPDKDVSLSGVFELYGRVYVSVESGGILAVENNRLIKSKLSINNGAEISFCEKQKNSNYILGTAEGRIFQFDEKLKLREIALEDKAYAKAGVVVSGSWVNDNLIALGTLRGGVMFVNSQTGKTEEIINYNTGLPDNEVFALMCDKNRNVWVAHDYGFTRIAPYLPLRSFSYYDNLHGNLLCALTFENQVYVGTSLGLFKLEKEEQYDEISYYVMVEQKKIVKKEKKKTITVVQEEVVQQPSMPEPESKKKGFFGFLKRKKNKEQEVVNETPKPENLKSEEQDEKQEETSQPVLTQEKRTQRILRSSNFVFKKVSGINAKVTQLLEVKGKLIAAGLAGVHEVNQLSATPLLQEPVRFVFASKELLLAASYDDKVRSWNLTGKAIEKTTLFDDFDDDVNFIFEGSANELWLCSMDQVHRVIMNKNKIDGIKTLQLPITNFDESVGIYWKSQTIIANAEGFFKYDTTKDTFMKIDSLTKPTSYFAWSNTIWYHDTHGWKSLGTFAKQSNLHLLNLFQDLRFITADQHHDNLWLITGNNELFKFFGERLHPHETAYPLIVKSIRNGEKKLSYKAKFKIDEQQSSLSIEVVQPDYIGSKAMEYRYFLDGMHDEWSEWSTANNMVDFPYLPPGKYSLLVQARNMFGNIKEMDPLAFVVQPPYWQRPWFYALEFAVFASLVLLSFRLSSRYLIVSRLLSLLTIILLIQFIQTVASASLFSKTSPVIDFFIQVFVALLILPVEGYLRKLMLKSHESTGLGQFIKSKTKGTLLNRKKE